MGVAIERFQQGDVFIDYDFEDVLFRFDAASRRYFRKFYGEPSEHEVPHDNRLLNDAIRFGTETDRTIYEAGRPSS
jgi:hypothetical protein